MHLFETYRLVSNFRSYRNRVSARAYKYFLCTGTVRWTYMLENKDRKPIPRFPAPLKNRQRNSSIAKFGHMEYVIGN